MSGSLSDNRRGQSSYTAVAAVVYDARIRAFEPFVTSPPENPTVPVRARDLIAELDHCMLEHRFSLKRAIRQADQRGKGLEKLARRVRESRALVAWRRENLPAVTFPEELPISEHAAELGRRLKENPVLVVCGETGSGKSTQIPKICLAAGYGIHGMIGQTQPRRIAARSVAERIGEELGPTAPDAVGYRVRFSEQVSPRNFIRVLTDGMLLAEFERDRFLERYEVLIIDEAHERSLNIDFLLGLSQRILAKRPDFRLVITSATLDSEKFSRHFNDAPSIAVSGRLYPVEVRYRPPEPGDGGTDALPASIGEAFAELYGEAPGDTLVFLPGEREIRDTADWLRKRAKPGIEVLPLYARLTPAEQHRIFSLLAMAPASFSPPTSPRPRSPCRVSATSSTAASPGSARYSPTRKLQRLPLEKISRAAADQRAGRCGRVASGVCIRLYAEDDYDVRAAYTDPEIQRTSLADVILRMKTLGIGDIETFPFVDRPGRRQINDGLQHLVELGALDAGKNVTDLGRRIARMPVDPRIARMLLAAEKEGCVDEVVVIAAALSLPDPRQSPSDQLQKAREKHRALSAEESDFMVLLDIWKQFRRLQKTQSQAPVLPVVQRQFPVGVPHAGMGRAAGQHQAVPAPAGHPFTAPAARSGTDPPCIDSRVVVQYRAAGEDAFGQVRPEQPGRQAETRRGVPGHFQQDPAPLSRLRPSRWNPPLDRLCGAGGDRGGVCPHGSRGGGGLDRGRGGTSAPVPLQ